MSNEEMFREFDFNEKPEKIVTSVKGLALPDDYLAFMQEHNGGEGNLGENNYGCFYRFEELLNKMDEETGVSCCEKRRKSGSWSSSCTWYCGI